MAVRVSSFSAEPPERGVLVTNLGSGVGMSGGGTRRPQGVEVRAPVAPVAPWLATFRLNAIIATRGEGRSCTVSQ